ncbi:MAG TPA: amidohydrolase family protein [Bacillota bacterium]|nr:amidohydrolase family protein [Bacillota bacterium]
MKKIDIYSHFAFPRLMNFLEEKSGRVHEFSQLFANTKSLIDTGARLEVMDRLGVEKHVLVPLPEIGTVRLEPLLAAEAAKVGNDEMGELVMRHPGRFSGVATLPTNNAEVMIAEFERAVTKLKLAGGVLGVGPNLKSLDHPDFEGLYARAVELNVPLWIHPARSAELPDYPYEQGGSKCQFFQAFSWLFDSTLAMHRLVFSGVFERYPALRMIIHHHGAIIPYFIGRLEIGIRFFEKNAGRQVDTVVQPPYAKHYQKFHVDTATQSYNPEALQMAVDFFGVEHLLFGTDAPMDETGGMVMGSNADQSVAALSITEEQRRQIYFGNAERILNQGSR